MARKIRIEYPGACYHIMNRGNRKEAIVLSDRDREVFMKTLGDVCDRTGWIISAYVLLDNHYHFLVETPEANLVDGMRWFQSTYTQRFNTRNRLVGHLFQGRYKSLIIDPKVDDYFLHVSDYIHLNPARAGLLDRRSPKLSHYTWSSYSFYLKPPGKRPSWLNIDRVFKELKIWKDNAAGRRKYKERMDFLVKKVLNPRNRKQFDEEWEKIRRGWCLGDDNFREKIFNYATEVVKGKKTESHAGKLKRLHDENAALELITEALSILEIDRSELPRMKKNVPQKQIIAWLVKTKTSVSNAWITEQLCMGQRTAVSIAMKHMKEKKYRELKKLKIKLAKTLLLSD